MAAEDLSHFGLPSDGHDYTVYFKPLSKNGQGRFVHAGRPQDETPVDRHPRYVPPDVKVHRMEQAPHVPVYADGGEVDDEITQLLLHGETEGTTITVQADSLQEAGDLDDSFVLEANAGADRSVAPRLNLANLAHLSEVGSKVEEEEDLNDEDDDFFEPGYAASDDSWEEDGAAAGGSVMSRRTAADSLFGRRQQTYQRSIMSVSTRTEHQALLDSRFEALLDREYAHTVYERSMYEGDDDDLADLLEDMGMDAEDDVGEQIALDSDIFRTALSEFLTEGHRRTHKGKVNRIPDMLNKRERREVVRKTILLAQAMEQREATHGDRAAVEAMRDAVRRDEENLGKHDEFDVESYASSTASYQRERQPATIRHVPKRRNLQLKKQEEAAKHEEDEEQQSADEMDGDDGDDDELGRPQAFVRPKGETSAERAARKKAVKEERRQRREAKKARRRN